MILETNTYDGDDFLEAELLHEIVEPQWSGIYDGEYTVIPKVYEQKLETEDKLMKYDVTVLPIPYREISDNKGTTVIIGAVISRE